jgi:2-dehydropantoate 2-reductase
LFSMEIKPVLRASYLNVKAPEIAPKARSLPGDALDVITAAATAASTWRRSSERGSAVWRRKATRGERGLIPRTMPYPSGEEGDAGGRRNLGSSWQSLMRRQGSIETDYLNGEIVFLGRKHGIPTPFNALLQQVANAMASARELPGKYSAEELFAMAERLVAGPPPREA